jgi:DNA-binding transcriptional LysR family regulator
MRRIEPRDLTLFLAIARHGSFRRAADHLGCTPSALSHALRSLEERLDVRLVNRTTRSAALTEAGERLYNRVAPAFREIDEAIDDLNTFRGAPSGRLRINAARGATQVALLPIVTRFLAAYPKISVEIAIDSAFVDLVSDGFDAGVRLGEIVAKDMIAVPLGPRQRSAYVASPAFLRQHAAPQHPMDLTNLPCIRLRFSSGRYYAWEFERAGASLTVEVDGRLTVGDQDLAIQAALQGTGIAFAFESQVSEMIAAGHLVRVLEDWSPAYPGFYLYYPGRRQLPAALRAFVDFAKAAASASRP